MSFSPLHRINMRNNCDDPMWSFFNYTNFMRAIVPKIFSSSRLLMPAICHVLVQTTCGVIHRLRRQDSLLGDGYELPEGRARSFNCIENSGLSTLFFESTLVREFFNKRREKWFPHFFRSKDAGGLIARRQALNFTALPIHSKVVKQMVAL